MAEYTIELGRLIECGYNGVHEAFQRLNPHFGDAEWAQEVEELFVDKFYLNEIGYETPDLFTKRMETAFKIILPYYKERRRINMLDLGIDPLSDFYEESIYTSTKTGASTSNTTGSPSTHITSERKTSGKDDTTGNPISKYDSTKNTTNKNDTTGAPEVSVDSSGNSTVNNYGNSHDSMLQYQFPMTGGSAEPGLPPGEKFNRNYASFGEASDNDFDNTNSAENKDNSVTKQKLDTHTTSENKDIFSETKNDTLDNHRSTTGEDKYTETKTDTLDTKTQSNTNDSVEDRTSHKGNHTARFEAMAKYREVIENLNAMMLSERRIEKLFMGVM